MRVTDYLIEVSDRCIRIADHGRRLLMELEAVTGPEGTESIPQLSADGRELADEVEAIGRELLAKAVELDTERQKNNPGAFGP